MEGGESVSFLSVWPRGEISPRLRWLARAKVWLLFSHHLQLCYSFDFAPYSGPFLRSLKPSVTLFSQHREESKGVHKLSAALKAPLEMSHTSSLLPSTGQNKSHGQTFCQWNQGLFSPRSIKGYSPPPGVVVVVQSLSRVWLFATPWTAVHQTSLSFTNSQSLLRLLSIQSVVPSNHLILCCPLLFPSIFPSIRGLVRIIGTGMRPAQVVPTK